jgi:hypothetical protein
MAHEHRDDVRRSHGDKLDALTGARGEHPMDRASRIAGVKVSASAQGDAASPEEEVFTAAPARQISNHGTVRGD